MINPETGIEKYGFRVQVEIPRNIIGIVTVLFAGSSRLYISHLDIFGYEFLFTIVDYKTMKIID